MPGKQYVFVIPSLQSILSIWNVLGSEVDLVLGIVCTIYDLLWIFLKFLVGFLVAKLSDSNLYSIIKGETATKYILKLYKLCSF